MTKIAIYVKAGIPCPKCNGQLFKEWNQLTKKFERTCLQCGYVLQNKSSSDHSQWSEL